MLFEKHSRISLKKSPERSRMRVFSKHARNFSSVLKDLAVVFTDKIAASLCVGWLVTTGLKRMTDFFCVKSQLLIIIYKPLALLFTGTLRECRALFKSLVSRLA